MLPFPTLWFSIFPLWSRIEQKTGALLEDCTQKLSRRNSNFCLVLCALQNRNTIPSKMQTIQENKTGFRKLSGRSQCRPERGNKMRTLFLRGLQQCSTREEKMPTENEGTYHVSADNWRWLHHCRHRKINKLGWGMTIHLIFSLHVEKYTGSTRIKLLATRQNSNIEKINTSTTVCVPDVMMYCLI